MSNRDVRVSAPKVEFPTHAGARTRWLSNAGLMIPDQRIARLKMEAARIRLPLNSPEWRIRAAWHRRRNAESWEIFDYDIFENHEDRYAYGGVQKDVQLFVKTARSIDPTIRFFVYARKDDPWLLDEFKTIYRGWTFDAMIELPA